MMEWVKTRIAAKWHPLLRKARHFETFRDMRCRGSETGGWMRGKSRPEGCATCHAISSQKAFIGRHELMAARRRVPREAAGFS